MPITKNMLASLLAALLVTAAGCKSSEPANEVDRPRQINYSQYQDWNFGDGDIPSSENPVFAWPQFAERLRREISFTLPIVGLDRTAESPDLLVYFYALAGDDKYNPVLPYQIGWAAEPFITNGEQFGRYPANTLVIDMVDPKINQLVWRGSTSLPFDEPDRLYRLLPERINTLLRNYPNLP